MSLVESQHPVATARGSALQGIFHWLAEVLSLWGFVEGQHPLAIAPFQVELSIRSLPLAVLQNWD
jgi:hypothetical protein